MSMVLRLQKKCLDKNEDLQSLLREALLISTKLKLNDFRIWVNNELNGYKNNIPDYRYIVVTPSICTFLSDWYDAPTSEDSEIVFSRWMLPDSVSELEHMLTFKQGNNFDLNLSHQQKTIILQLYPNAKDIRLYIPQSVAACILGKVRTVLLEWTLKLEEDNILGSDDLIFSEDEKKAAQHIHIENFNGVMGNVDKVGNMSTGANATNIYNENNINNEIDKLINEIKQLNLADKKEVIRDLEDSKDNPAKAKVVLGGLLSRGSEVASIGSVIIDLLGLLK